jgi:general stress protein 26
VTDDPAGSVAKVAELAKDIHIGMLTTMDAEGRHISRPMAQQEVEFDGDLWMFSARDARKVQHITANPAVNVTLTSKDTWISIHGTATVVDDVAKKKELWNGFVDAWFENGPEDPAVVLLKIEAEGAEYWDTPGGRIAQVISFVKMKITGEPYDGGENERVEL